MRNALISSIGVVIVLIAVIIYMYNRLNDVKSERDIQAKNVETLLAENESYRVNDSLMASTVLVLKLSIEQYRKYRSEDYSTIEKLKVDKKRLEGVVTAQMESYARDTAILRDSIISILGKDSLIYNKEVKTASFSNPWHDLDVIIDKDTLSYELRNRERILITNHVVPKRFLGFLWKYGVKEIRTEAVSMNPYTKKMDIESIIIE